MFAYGTAGAGWLPIAGDWNGPGQRANGGRGEAAQTGMSAPLALSQADLRPIVNEAIARWANAGLDAAALAKLTQAQFAIADLPGSYLGKTQGNQITIDSNAAGYGWFVDPTPAVDEEFAAEKMGTGTSQDAGFTWASALGSEPVPVSSQQLQAIDPRAVDRIDLLTVVEHELGHVAGLGDLDASVNDLMSGTLGVGTRRNASPVDAALASE